jgi:hypothetical protein
VNGAGLLDCGEELIGEGSGYGGDLPISWLGERPELAGWLGGKCLTDYDAGLFVSLWNVG